MFEVDRALEHSASYEQIGPRRWRVCLTGMVMASAEAATPGRCTLQLMKAVDYVRGRALRGIGPFTSAEDGTTASLAPAFERLLMAGTTDAQAPKSDPD